MLLCLTKSPGFARLFRLIVRLILSTKNLGSALDGFKLFYEEIATIKRTGNRLKRVRQASAVS